jgi:hypothetical protein
MSGSSGSSGCAGCVRCVRACGRRCVCAVCACVRVRGRCRQAGSC